MENGNHIEIPMDELPPAQDTVDNDNVFNELCNLLKKSKIEINSYDTYLTRIKNILSENAEAVFSKNVKGKNIFHFLANNPDRNPDVLKIFQSYFDGSDREGSKRLSQSQAEALFYAQFGEMKHTPVHMAVNNGFGHFVREILTAFPSVLSSIDGESNTPLHVAAKSSMPESLAIMETILNVIEKNYLSKEILVDALNSRGHTIIHTLCSNVPNNESSRVVEKLQKLLQFDCTKDILRIWDDTKKNPLQLLCSREEQNPRIEPDDNKNLQNMLTLLISSREGVNLKSEDKHGYTPLHLLTISECPKLLDLLISRSKESIDLTIRDGHERMAIHYAEEKAMWPKCEKIIRKLADWPRFREVMMSVESMWQPQDLYRNYILWETFSGVHGRQNTTLTSVCESKNSDLVEYLLRNVLQAKPEFHLWFLGKDEFPDLFSLKSVYEHTPEALTFLYDQSIDIDMENSNKNCLYFSTDISVLTALHRPIQEEKTYAEMEYLGNAENWPEDVQAKLLLHPLSKCALHEVWKKMLPFRILWFIYNIFWLGAYYCIVPLNPPTEEESTHSTKWQTYGAWALVVLCILSTIYYVTELILILTEDGFVKCLKRRMYSWLLVVVSGIIAYKILMERKPTVFLNLNAAVGIVLCHSLIWWNFGIVNSSIGIKIDYHKQTLLKIVQHVGSALPMMVGFFCMFMLVKPGYLPGELGFAINKFLVMMTGENDFPDNEFEDSKSNKTTEEESVAAVSNWITNLLFLMFLFLITISFYNLVVAAAVDKILGMKRKFEINHALCQLRHINYVQKSMVLVLDGIARCLPFLNLKLKSYLSYRSIGNETVFDQKLVWFVERKTTGRNINDSKAQNGAICGNGLPASFQSKLFEDFNQRINID